MRSLAVLPALARRARAAASAPRGAAAVAPPPLVAPPLRHCRPRGVARATATAGVQRTSLRHGRAPTALRAAAAAAGTAPPSTAPSELDVAEAAIRSDLTTLFTDAGVDAAHYEPGVAFTDPLASFSGVRLYQLNIAFLRRAFSPVLTTHSLARTGPLEITTRWTMTMSAPLLAEAVFTGTSVYGLSPGTGLVRSHTDTWDSVTGRGAAAVVDLLKQVLSPQRTPPLEGPVYEVLLRRPGYEVRRYGASVEAVTRMPASAGPAGDGGGFGTLAGYIFGGNVTGEKMEMTTPVFTRVAADGKGSMAFPLERRLGPDPAGAPAPLDGARVARAVAPAGVRAAARFGGVATDGDVAREERVLRAALLADGLRPAAGYALARYNDPFTLPFFRRNEVLIDLEAPPPEFAA